MSLHKDLALLVSPARERAEAALKEMQTDPVLKSLGVEEVAVSESRRDLAVQMAYYSRGRMHWHGDVQAMYKAAKLWPISEAETRQAITWTMDSKHIVGMAVDFVPVKDGSPWWKAPATVWNRMGEIGEACGLKWGGRWKKQDCPHFEI
jgi:hypothetical protein